MEIKNGSQIVLLDACTLINILYIDEDEFLGKLLKKVNFFIAEKVFEETKKNLLSRLTFKQKNDVKIKNNLSSRLLHLSSNVIKNKHILELIDPNFINDSLNVFNYRKQNGEYFSSCYALLISRLYNTKVIFVTDDYPARKHFTKYYEFQQIGYVEDVVDLLVFLSTMSNSFTTIMLNNYFTSILSAYNSQIVDFKKELEKFRNILTIQQKKDRFLSKNLTSLIKKLSEFELGGLKIYRNKFNTRNYSTLRKIIKNYDSVFDINSESLKSMSQKVNNTIKSLKKYKLYKI